MNDKIEKILDNDPETIEVQVKFQGINTYRTLKIYVWDNRPEMKFWSFITETEQLYYSDGLIMQDYKFPIDVPKENIDVKLGYAWLSASDDMPRSIQVPVTKLPDKEGMALLSHLYDDFDENLVFDVGTQEIEDDVDLFLHDMGCTPNDLVEWEV